MNLFTPEEDLVFDLGEEATETPEAETTEVAEETEATEAAATDEVVEEETAFDWAGLELKGVDGITKLGDYKPEDLKALLQKGGDYDRIREGYDQFKAFKEVSDLYGYEVAEMLEQLKSNHFKNEADKNGSTIETERDKYQLNKDKQLLEQEKQQLTAEQQEKAKADEQLAKLTELVTKFPELDPNNLPQELVTAYNNGDNLVTAYTMLKNSDMAKQIEQLKQQLENAEKAPVMATTGHGDNKESLSAFEKGFLGD